jgi:nucleoside-triphosphatase THEP1
MLSLYNQHHLGDGFVALKKMDKEKIVGFDCLHLSTQKIFPYAIHDYYYNNQFQTTTILGPYHFNEDTLLMIEKTFDELISLNISPLYLDEVGQLELNNQGNAKILQKLIDHHCELYLSIREEFIEKFVQKYHLNEYQIIASL